VHDYIDSPTGGQSTLFAEMSLLLMPIEQDFHRAKLLHSDDISAVANIALALPICSVAGNLLPTRAEVAA
jgi:hypothetical protein